MFIKNVAFGIMLTLLISPMIFTVNIQSIKAEPTTIVVPDDYTTIQEAINNANEGDTIFVRNGTYYEHVVVNKSLSLIGANKFDTIIDGGVETFYPLWKGYSMTITGFTIQNGGIWTGESDFSTVYINISSNIIDGAMLSGSATVTDNDINGGIYMRFHGGNTISRNNIRGGTGIYQLYSEGGWNTIVGNNITDSDGDGIFLAEDSFDIIQGNNITNSKWAGINLHDSEYCSIIGNRIEGNSRQGIVLSLASCFSVIGNTIAGNSLGISLALQFPSNDYIYHNNFINNTNQVNIYEEEPNSVIWDNGYPSGGNYWSDYNGTDANVDGIGDTPYVIDENNQDNYPLVHPYGSIRNLNTNLTYLTIQFAINAPQTLNGHTIFIKSGTYHEHIVVNKTLSLIGEDRDTTIIDGNHTGHVIFIDVGSPVNITSFTIRNGNTSGIFAKASDFGPSNVSYNMITNNTYGIYSHSSLIIARNIIANNNVGIQGAFGDGPSYFTISENNVTTNHDYGISLGESASHTISGNNITKNGVGVCLYHTFGSNISENRIVSNDDSGIILASFSSNNMIYRNTISNNTHGIYVSIPYVRGNNTIIENDITNNSYGIWFAEEASHDMPNRIYHNNLIDNDNQAYIYQVENSKCIWDDNYPSGGNYWSDYIYADIYHGTYQNLTGSDGIGDSPYIIDENNKDNYPLMKPYPWDSHDIGVTSLTSSKSVVAQSSLVEISVMLFNYGNYTENVHISIYMNSNERFSAEFAISNKSRCVVNFFWYADELGNYTIEATADAVIGETDTADNTLIKYVLITILGDINGDKWVNAKDAIVLGVAFYPFGEYNPNADINGDGYCNAKDAVILGIHFNEHWE